MIAERRAHPTGDLTSALLDVDDLADDDVIAFLFLMVVAGNETTAKLLANAWYYAWKFPDQREPATRNIPGWVEETLRFDPSSQMTTRTLTRDVELHGRRVPAGDRVMLIMGSANRDEDVFPHADRYDVDRDTSSSIGFGAGPHFCMGAALARIEGRVALEELTKRVKTYDVDESGITRVHSVNVRGLSSLPTTVTPR